ncbi:ABC transporter ATP-binding protein/permease [Adlercreutzia sp. R25]|uniref:ABC transporter ATP-binding protein/permease n=1 Tax=Adlercreutzia shanghongiae TaxID=3111773 RepID=A0ABU6IY64_9ACTN|nr:MULTISPECIES: ABC transporter ATP-binding protein/permease [unclassified Adlercreutzia]MEC4271785.1 ABC transporter ATP-binding protein/permease [Adlercreutzia sp. R25]MEC4294792.1 ABC transporter ATP-binding protein/permease [Adlercreutzia sp. R22]
MLQLKNICKSYRTGDFTQVALNDVSISFRDNEFVAILGPSGSGKTTLLNVMGGLDHYDSGDMVVDGISTHRYKDRDWDTFRNNRIGFVFQSYNLIPHQSILQNVELALTLSGVGKAERTRRAKEALAAVGLAEHVNKKPSQLSGGQMQRVAIARALINDPEIVLADEPTGALDSHTSVQIMDLLTQIAKDRLVIMVTHNPELAAEYATRTVNLADGVIRSDTDPYFPTEEEMHASRKPVRKTSMSFLTALALSANNLMTKKGRTIMTAFAGSIGIIGIAAILALANGVDNYIERTEEETLSVYPLQIMSTGFDMTALMGMAADEGDDAGAGSTESDGNPLEEAGFKGGTEGDENDPETSGKVPETRMVTDMFASLENNDLASLKLFLDENGGDINSYVNSIEYSYNVAPQIFDGNTEAGVRQINPDTTFSAFGMGGTSSNALMSTMYSTDVFSEMMGNTAIVEDQYDVKAGRWPEAYNECVVVLTGRGTVPDLVSYALGLRDHAVLEDMIKQFMNEEDVESPEDDLSFTYDQIMGVSLKMVPAADFYSYDETNKVWVDKTGDEDYMKNLVDNGEELKIVGIVQPRPDAKATALSMGIYYTPALTQHLIDQAKDAAIVQEQLNYPSIDVFNGKEFSEEDGSSGSDFSMDNLFSIDEGAIQDAFKFDESKLSMDPSALQDGMSADDMPAPPALDPSSLNLDMSSAFNGDAMGEMMGAALAGYTQALGAAYQQAASSGTPPDFQQLAQSTLESYAQSSELQTLMAQYAGKIVDANAMQKEMATKISAALQSTMTAYMEQVMAQVAAKTEASMAQMMTQLQQSIPLAMSVDTNAFQNAFQMKMTEEELTELIMSLMARETRSFDANLNKLGYAELSKPSQIDIYPDNFEDKQQVIAILDDYNDRMVASGQDDKKISYTDFVGTLMKSVTTIVDMISYVLIAFVAISLVVSSIMIGIITYISVLERKKEIGILRAIGASKGDISRVFNAETIIEGLVAGLIGVGVVALACIPANAIVYAMLDVPDIALLPVTAGAILVAISVFLSFVAGLFPAMAAARKDPVEALRSE